MIIDANSRPCGQDMHLTTIYIRLFSTFAKNSAQILPRCSCIDRIVCLHGGFVYTACLRKLCASCYLCCSLTPQHPLLTASSFRHLRPAFASKSESRSCSVSRFWPGGQRMTMRRNALTSYNSPHVSAWHSKRQLSCPRESPSERSSTHWMKEKAFYCS